MARFTKENAAIYAKRGNIAKWAPKAAVSQITRDHGLNGLEAESRWVKGGLSKEMLNQVRLLEITPCRSIKALANNPDREGRASLVARITDTAAKVYGWDSDKSNVMVLVNMTEALDPDKAAPIVDVQEVPSPS